MLQDRTLHLDLPRGARIFLGGPWVFLALFAPSLLYRRLTAERRVLPDVFLIGATKCGTTSLAAYLARHPGFVPAQNPEPMFLQDIPNYVTKYDRNPILRTLWGSYADGVDAYRKFFPTRARMAAASRRAGARALTGDLTPLYLYCPTATRRVRELCPTARLLVLLRNPVDRAFSDYTMFATGTKLEPRTFEQAIDDELYGCCRDFALSYLAQSTYEPHLRRWMEAFSREQFLILDSRELFREPERAVRRAFDLLGLPQRDLGGNFGVHNRGGYRSAMQPATRARLVEYFRPHNRRLFDLLGESFGWDE